MPTLPEHARCVSMPNSENFIDTLPEELLIMIVEEIDDPVTWSKLCRVNKRFKPIAEENLYSSLKFGGHQRSRDPDPRNPLVPRYVLDLELYVKCTMEDDWISVLQNARNLQALFARFSLHHRDLIFPEPAFVLLATATNPAMPQPLPHSFSTLKLLDITVRWVSLEDFLFLFDLPNLVDLTLKTVFQKKAFPPAKIRQLDCKLRYFSLYGFLHPVAWTQLLSFTTGLKKFMYVYNEASCEPFNAELPNWALPNLSALVDALKLQKDSLEVIYIEDGIISFGDPEFLVEGEDYCEGLSALKDFPHLTSLRAPLKALMKDGIPDLSLSLPRQLQVLATDVRADTAELSGFDSVFESLKKVFPSTGPRELVLSFAPDYPFEDIKISPSLRTLEKYGVAMCFDWRNTDGRRRLHPGIFDLTQLEEREAGLVDDLEESDLEIESIVHDDNL